MNRRILATWSFASLTCAQLLTCGNLKQVYQTASCCDRNEDSYLDDDIMSILTPPPSSPSVNLNEIALQVHTGDDYIGPLYLSPSSRCVDGRPTLRYANIPDAFCEVATTTSRKDVPHEEFVIVETVNSLAYTSSVFELLYDKQLSG